jgi:hypothetical protein
MVIHLIFFFFALQQQAQFLSSWVLSTDLNQIGAGTTLSRL